MIVILVAILLSLFPCPAKSPQASPVAQRCTPLRALPDRWLSWEAPFADSSASTACLSLCKREDSTSHPPKSLKGSPSDFAKRNGISPISSSKVDSSSFSVVFSTYLVAVISLAEISNSVATVVRTTDSRPSRQTRDRLATVATVLPRYRVKSLS